MQKAEASKASVSVPPVSSTSPLVDTNPVLATKLAIWQAPIDFYGKVVDQDGNPVAGAEITFRWVETPSEEGNKTTNILSDANGLFSLTGERGPNLSVAVRKDGYYTSRSTPDSFRYALRDEIFQPDRSNPVTFFLRKKGQGVELITSDNGMRSNVAVRVPKNNSPIRVDLFQKRVSPDGQLEISQSKPPWAEATEWSFRLIISGGGLKENGEEFQFEAPETNYSSTAEYHFTKSGTNWTTHVSKQFYLTFGQPPRYGWLRIESDLAQETVFVTYAINPLGSRNLEPAN